jgi:hypothetical protein
MYVSYLFLYALPVRNQLLVILMKIVVSSEYWELCVWLTAAHSDCFHLASWQNGPYSLKRYY